MKSKVIKGTVLSLIAVLSFINVATSYGQQDSKNKNAMPRFTKSQLDSIKKIMDDRLHNDWAYLQKYAADNNNLPAVSPGEHRVVFMGNSITEFWKTIDGDFFSTNKNFIDRGISGQTTPQMLLRFRDDVINLKPSVVVILAGTNDIAGNTGPTTIEEIFGNIVSMIELARANSIKVVLCSVLPAYDYPWRPGLEPAGKIMKLNSMLKSYANKNSIVYTDFFTPMADQRDGLKSEYSKDGVHPNLAGYKVMDDLVVKAINRALKMK
ncbi:MAG TPA: SGNH/GDSL hydrolase family protein [Bacteroidales bacterium]|nr:SGNH/GDSL hydrolase family protein [Bacteroidales bacterium]